jgi:preprotein translocase subunit SecA
MLKEKGLDVNVLNAKSDSEEARIISQAGRRGAITISTAMAGRGTDIKLGCGDDHDYQDVKSLGGLYVIGTYRHESKRVDNQLRGRAGRQGDPGKSKFIISLEDDLLINFGIADLLPKNFKEHPEYPLEHFFLFKSVDKIQQKIEEQHYKIRKTLVTYAGVLDEQRLFFQENREDILINGYKPVEGGIAYQRQVDLHSQFSQEEIADFWRIVALITMDDQWSRHLQYVNKVKESIHLSSLAGLKPTNEFKRITAEAYIQMMDHLDARIEVEFQEKALTEKGRSILTGLLSNPSSTYTELISDQPFGEWFELLYISTSKTDLRFMKFLFWPILSIFSNTKNFR